MSERIAAAVWVKPRRRFAFVTALAAFLVAFAVLIGALSSDSSAAPAKRRTHHAANVAPTRRRSTPTSTGCSGG